MQWNPEINLENFIVSSASYGGPLAIRRDDRKLTKVRGPGQVVISIFSGSGNPISSFKVRNNKRRLLNLNLTVVYLIFTDCVVLQWNQRPIIHMGWSTDEKLICIQDDGNVTIYDMFGKLFHKFNVFQKIHDSKLVDAKVFTNTRNVTGIAVMTSNYHIFIINSIKDIKTRQLSDVPSMLLLQFNCILVNWLL